MILVKLNMKLRSYILGIIEANGLQIGNRFYVANVLLADGTV